MFDIKVKDIGSKTLIEDLEASGLSGFIVLEPEEDFSPALIGYDKVQNRLIYSFDLMIQTFTEIYEEGDETGDPQDLAYAWITYNTMRAIPYMGSTRPIIVYLNLDGDYEEY